jgi:hypothetical protein
MLAVPPAVSDPATDRTASDVMPPEHIGDTIFLEVTVDATDTEDARMAPLVDRCDRINPIPSQERFEPTFKLPWIERDPAS